MIPVAIKRWRRSANCKHRHNIIIGPGVTECADCGKRSAIPITFPSLPNAAQRGVDWQDLLRSCKLESENKTLRETIRVLRDQIERKDMEVKRCNATLAVHADTLIKAGVRHRNEIENLEREVERYVAECERLRFKLGKSEMVESDYATLCQLKDENEQLKARVKEWIGVAAKIANSPDINRRIHELQKNLAYEELQSCTLAGRIEQLAAWIDRRIRELENQVPKSPEHKIDLAGQLHSMKYVRLHMANACTTRPAMSYEKRLLKVNESKTSQQGQ